MGWGAKSWSIRRQTTFRSMHFHFSTPLTLQLPRLTRQLTSLYCQARSTSFLSRIKIKKSEMTAFEGSSWEVCFPFSVLLLQRANGLISISYHQYSGGSIFPCHYWCHIPVGRSHGMFIHIQFRRLLKFVGIGERGGYDPNLRCLDAKQAPLGTSSC